MLFTPCLQAMPVQGLTRAVAAPWTRVLRKRLHDKKLNGFFAAAYQAPDDIHREAAALKKARALGALLARRCRLAVLALEDGLSALEFPLSGNRVDDVFGDSLRPKIVPDARDAVLA